jgi:ubiquinone/menaquinone biosynthesis C-methylase UbiE
VKAGDRGHPIFAAFFDRMSRSMEKRGLAELRREIVGQASGSVVEIGAGTGLNFGHYPQAVTDVVAIEPDPHMLRRLRESVGTAPVAIRAERASAEELPFEDETIDTVVGTLVLCTVPDPAKALSEVHRILKPGGRYLFLEHVRSNDRRLARWQDRIQPVWTFFGAGCHPNRDTPTAIQSAGLELERLERFDFSPNMIVDKPHAKGMARKPA